MTIEQEIDKGTLSDKSVGIIYRKNLSFGKWRLIEYSQRKDEITRTYNYLLKQYGDKKVKLIRGASNHYYLFRKF